MGTLDTLLELDDAGRAAPATDAEQRLLAAARTGDPAVIPGCPKADSETGWTDDQAIRAEFLRHLCVHPDRYDMDPRGIWLLGGRIVGHLDLMSATLERPLVMEGTRLEEQPLFVDATTKTLVFQEGCRVPGMWANRLRVDGLLRLADSTFDGMVQMLGANIESDLACFGTTFNNEGGVALDAKRLKVGGSVFLNEAQAKGKTDLEGSSITVDLVCKDAVFSNEGGDALHAKRLKVGGSMFLSRAKAKGKTDLEGSSITVDLVCADAELTNEGGEALIASRLNVGGGVYLNHITVHGETRLVCATINSNLECTGANFVNPNDDEDSEIPNELEMIETRNAVVIFEKRKKIAFNAQRMRVTGRFRWTLFPSPPLGDVDFRDARVGDYIDDGTGWPNCANGNGHLFLNGFRYESWGHEATSKHLCEWLCQMPQSDAEKKPSFYPQPYEQLVKVFHEFGHDTKARKIAMAKQDALHAHLLRRALHHFDYTLPRRMGLCFLKWTAGYGYKPSRALFWALGFMMLGAVIFETGQINGTVLPAQQLAYIHPCADEKADLNDKACKGVWHPYSTERDYAWLPDSLQREINAKAVSYPMPDNYVVFDALAYSVDVFVPILDLQQETSWMPKAGWARVYMWLHIIAGWVLTTIAVAGFTGLIKQD